MNQSTYYQLNSGVTRTSSSTYYVGCALDDVAPSVRIVVFNEDSSIYVLNVLEYNVKNSNHYFYGVEGVNYSVYVGSGSTSGYALCEPQ
ncbi:MAG: hypothetical protein M1480_11085 [Bacteroidetes bacterium]|nr:hypothetical protein [Bacteroidota bacterium]